MAEEFRKHGATRVVETLGAPLPRGEVTSCPLAVWAGEEETGVMSWRQSPDHVTLEARFQRAVQDPAAGIRGDVPINGMTMFFAGIDALTNLSCLKECRWLGSRQSSGECDRLSGGVWPG